MDLNLDTFLLIGILSCVFIHLRVSEKDRKETRNHLLSLLEMNIKIEEGIRMIDHRLSDK